MLTKRCFSHIRRQWDSWVHGGEGENAFHYRLPGYETDELTNLFTDYLKSRSEINLTGEKQPFFAVLSVQPPHDPYAAPEEYMKKFNPSQLIMRKNVPDIPDIREKAQRDIAGAYAMIENLDHNIGKIINTLRETGLEQDTHIIFFSDHGDMHGSHGQFLKTTPFEEAIRVPFIIGGEHNRYDGRKTGRFNVLINHVDIAPTTLGLCGIDKPDFMEGSDYSGYRLRDREINEPDSAFIQSVIPTGHRHSVDKAWRGVITKDGWKYVCFEKMPYLMFNLNTDPYEQVNLAHNPGYKDIRKRLNDRLNQWITDTDDSFELPNY